ncbi:type II toxin-antitoxin system antitoxin SocA domain-containing protein [Ornithinibacillus sp. FSL M8-0202]|uniref:Panacea domain-containing protein n=1 Tax=Ornithinibacillus sp. FSL M8-0202 TaxID=2921616 RepID=UPI0030CEE021
MPMQNFADHTIAISKEYGGISNLKLQKVLYFALGQYIRDNGINDLVRDIYTERFEAWQYGPVIKSEYHRNKHFGRYNIRREAQIHENYNDLNDYIIKNLNRSVTDLVEDSHSRPTWSTNREAILSNQIVTYDLRDLQNDFS